MRKARVTIALTGVRVVELDIADGGKYPDRAKEADGYQGSPERTALAIYEIVDALVRFCNEQSDRTGVHLSLEAKVDPEKFIRVQK